MNKPILFIDRDGALISKRETKSLENLSFIPRVFRALSEICALEKYRLVMLVRNNEGGKIQKKLIETFENEGIYFDDVHFLKNGNKLPKDYADDEYDIEQSFVIGHGLEDLKLAKSLNCKAIFLNADEKIPGEMQRTIALQTNSWQEIAAFLLHPPRKAIIHRKTNETEISIALNLDGTGTSNINTGLRFFDHMLDQLAHHGQMDLDISVKGDLDVDEHHTIEDTAISLGQAFDKALGQKKGVERYGFYLPMDDALAQVAIDFGGRRWLVWEANFDREYVGDVPTEMFYHFFKSFSDEARCNLNIKIHGENEHHKIEATFKALARAIKMAVKRDPRNKQLPSTKGVL